MHSISNYIYCRAVSPVNAQIKVLPLLRFNSCALFFFNFTDCRPSQLRVQASSNENTLDKDFRVAPIVRFLISLITHTFSGVDAIRFFYSPVSLMIVLQLQFSSFFFSLFRFHKQKIHFLYDGEASQYVGRCATNTQTRIKKI